MKQQFSHTEHFSFHAASRKVKEESRIKIEKENIISVMLIFTSDFPHDILYRL
jgi:hypothetical protein